jgi:hypothetical protein
MSLSANIYRESLQRTPYKGIKLEKVPIEVQNAYKGWLSGNLSPYTEQTVITELKRWGFVDPKEGSLWFERAMKIDALKEPEESLKNKEWFVNIGSLIDVENVQKQANYENDSDSSDPEDYIDPDVVSVQDSNEELSDNDE